MEVNFERNASYVVNKLGARGCSLAVTNKCIRPFQGCDCAFSNFNGKASKSVSIQVLLIRLATAYLLRIQNSYRPAGYCGAKK
jgi:hypothetical protein